MIEERVLERMKELLKFNHWSLYKLAKMSGLSYSSLSNLFHRNTCPSIPTLERICKGFEIGIPEFFDFSQNPLRNDQLTEEEQNLINSFRELSKKDKELLLTYVRGLSKQ